MIVQNARQYRITKSWIARFEKRLIVNEAQDPPPNVDPRMKQLVHDSMTSEIEVLRGQLDHYEKLRDGRITGRELASLDELPVALIEARIAAGLTQRALAERLEIPEQQVQRWEAHEYSGVEAGRLQEIADAVGAQTHTTITYSSARDAKPTPRARPRRSKPASPKARAG